MTDQAANRPGAGPPGRRRVALVLAAESAARGAPPGTEAAAFAAACLADTYEVLADLEEVTAGIVGPAAGTDGAAEIAELLWPRDLLMPLAGEPLRSVAERLAGTADELVLVPADAPDLPGLVLAKVFKALNKADVCVAPARNSPGWVAFGVRLPWPEWLTVAITADRDPTDELLTLAPRRNLVASGPDWHRMCDPEAINRLDPRLEGWDATRLLLSGPSAR